MSELPAAMLSRAATAIRATSVSAYPGPWISDDSEDCWRLHSAPDPHFPTAQILKAPKHGTPYAEYWPDGPTAAHITAWHPGVALAVADWLDATAADMDNVAEDYGGWDKLPGDDPTWKAALKAACTFLGESDAA